MGTKYLNRDVSWLSFNLRVSDEAKHDWPLQDKVLFHGITWSNLDEFLQVRYPIELETISDVDLQEFLDAVTNHYLTLSKRFKKFNDKYQIIRKVKDLKKSQLEWAEKIFRRDVFPALQPITIDKSRQINPRAGTYVLFRTEYEEDEYVNYVELPSGISRFIPVPNERYAIDVLDLLQYFKSSIFKDRKFLGSVCFSISRSAEVYAQNDLYSDPYELIQRTLRERARAWITKLEVGSNKKSDIKLIRSLLPITSNTITFASDYVKLSDLKSISSSIYEEKERSKKREPYDTWPAGSVFDYIRKEDRLAFHPYESYQTTMVRFLEEASVDPDVVSIKISLYRVSDNSRIIAALLKAADKGKNVTVLIELKARFDEHHNMEISKTLREGGVRLVYTDPNMKTHAKLCLVTRKEKKGLRIYAQVGTGNYSESNSKQYTDYSYFTANQEVCFDLTRFFNLLTSNQGTFKSRHIVYAPHNMREILSDNIDEQIKLAKKGKKARIICKCNTMADDKMADKLYEAAKAGVKVTMIIRGACIMQPTKNIKIYSIIDQKLEHSRVYVFGYGKNCKVEIGSADLMYRNLSRRNELLIQVDTPELKKRLLKHMEIYLKDNTNRRVILPKYKYEELKPSKKESAFNAQEAFWKEAKRMALN